MQTEIKSPAITVRAERGRDGVDEGTTIGGSVIANEEPRVTVAFAGGSRVVKEEFEFGKLVEASVNVTVNGAVPDNGVPVKFAAGVAGLEIPRYASIIFFRIVVILSLLEIPVETIVLTEVLPPSFFINEAK